MSRSLLKFLIRPFVGKRYQQSFYEKLHLLSLVGMNYGIGGDLKVSGELSALKFVKRKLLKQKKKFILFDVGANVGDYTKALLQVFNGSDFEIYSFEPSKKIYRLLKNNINSRHSQLLNIGLSDVPGKLKLYSGSEDTGLTSVYQRNLEHINITLDHSEEIELTTIDLFCERNNIDNIDFIKMDVEGHEFKVLEGAKKMLSEGRIKFIQFEFGGCNLDSRIFFKDFYYLLRDNYNIYRIVGNGVRKIKRYDEIGQEIFITINFLAELKKL